MFKSESIDLDGVTFTFIESERARRLQNVTFYHSLVEPKRSSCLPDFEIIFEGVVYCVSLVLDRTGVLGGTNTSGFEFELL